MDEKDRLGDKLREKEKAAEDLYIAEQERLRRIKKAAAEAAASGTGCCPRDGRRLEAHTGYGVRSEVCPLCHGVWFDRHDLEQFHKLEGEAGVTRWIRSLLGR